MASPISQLSNSFTTYATGNLLVVVDVTDTSMAASGTDKRITLSQFFSNYVFKASGSSHAGGFVPDPGATAGASRYLSENGLWVKPTGVYNVKDYGAVGNGVADDTSAIQAAITAANSAGGGCVYFPATGNTGSAGYLVSSPLIIPRPGNPPIGVVTLRGDATRTSKIVQSTTFPANRSVIEWTLVRSQVWCQSITDLMITLSASVYGGGAIHFQLSATPTSYTDVAAEKGQFELRRLLIETNNPNNPYAIYLEGGHYCCVFEDLIADNGHPSLANPTYDTILLKGSSQVYFNNSDDIPGFFQPVLKNLTATIRRGGYGSIFEGRLNQANFFNAEAQGGRTGPTYKFTNSVQCWLSNLGGEGQSESSQFYFDNCENIICDNIGLGTPDPVYPAWSSGSVISVGTTVRPTDLGVNNNYFRCTVAGTTGGTEPSWPTGAGDTVVDGSVTWVQEGKATGDGIVLVNTSNCMFRSRASWSTKPTWKSQRGAYVINIDSNSFNNEFVGFCLNGTPSTECVFPTYANRNYGEFWNDIDSTYHVVGTKIPSISTASLPSASANVGQLVYVPDAVVGTQLQYSNGVGWQPAGPGAALTAPIVSAAPSSTAAYAGIAVGTTYYYKVGAVTSTGTELAGPQTGFTLTATRAPNLLSQTIAEDWTVASWGKVHASAALGSDVDPVFGNTTDKLTEDATTNNHYTTVSVNPGSGAAVFSVYAKAAGRGFLQVYCFSGSTVFNAYVNLSTGAVTNLVAGTFTVTNAGGGWWRILVNYTAPASAHSVILFMGSAAGTNNYAGDGTSGVSLWGALSQTGSGSPPYIDNAVALSWTPSTSAASYNVYRASVSNAFGSPSLLTNTGGTSYTDVGNAVTTGSPPGSGDINVGAGGNLNMADPANIVIGTSTGTKIGTSTSQKLSFYNATPIVRPTGDIVTALGNLGLVGSPSIALTDLGTGTPGATNFLRGDGTWNTAVTSVTFTGDGVILSTTPSSAVTTSGTVTASLLTQTANRVLAGPTNGSPANPTFRAIVPADVPVFIASGATHAAGIVPDPGVTSGTTKYLREDATWQTAVSSVTFTGDGTVLSSTPSSAVTTSGTVTASLKTQSANLVLAGPTSGGAVAPTFRSLVANDVPSALNPTTFSAGSDAAVAILKAYSSQTADLLTVESSTPVVKGGINSNYNLYGTIAADVVTGRLTLSSSLPIADTTSASTVYYLPYEGRGTVTIYNTTSSQYEQWLFGTSGLSLSLSGASTNTLYDIFVYNNSGTLTLEKVAWTNSGSGTSARATAVSSAGDYWYKSGSQGHRYLGTILTDGSSNANDLPTSRTLWNQHNRVARQVQWSYMPSPNPFTINNGSTTGSQVFGVLSSGGSNPMQLPVVAGQANISVIMLNLSAFAIAPDGTGLGTAYLGVSTSSTSYTSGSVGTQINSAVTINTVYLGTSLQGLGYQLYYCLGANLSTNTSQTAYYYGYFVLSGLYFS